MCNFYRSGMRKKKNSFNNWTKKNCIYIYNRQYTQNIWSFANNFNIEETEKRASLLYLEQNYLVEEKKFINRITAR